MSRNIILVYIGEFRYLEVLHSQMKEFACQSAHSDNRPKVCLGVCPFSRIFHVIHPDQCVEHEFARKQPLQVIHSSDPTVGCTPAWIRLSEDQRMCVYNLVLQVVEGFTTTDYFVLLAWLHICERSPCNQFIILQ